MGKVITIRKRIVNRIFCLADIFVITGDLVSTTISFSSNYEKLKLLGRFLQGVDYCPRDCFSRALFRRTLNNSPAFNALIRDSITHIQFTAIRAHHCCHNIISLPIYFRTGICFHVLHIANPQDYCPRARFSFWVSMGTISNRSPTRP